MKLVVRSVCVGLAFILKKGVGKNAAISLALEIRITVLRLVQGSRWFYGGLGGRKPAESISYNAANGYYYRHFPGGLKIQFKYNLLVWVIGCYIGDSGPIVGVLSNPFII